MKPAEILKNPKVWWIAAILAAGALGFYFRLYPLTVFPRDLSRSTSQFVVTANMRRSATAQITRNHPELPPDQVSKTVNALVSQKIRQSPQEFARAVQKQAVSVERDMRTASRGGFLLEVDPYYYMSQTERILKTGRISENTRGREFHNPMTLAPEGYWYPMDLHPFVGAWLDRLVTFFLPRVDLVAVLRWVPMLAALLALAVFAVFCRRVAGITGWAGFLGMVYLLLCPMFLKRSLVGWYDTDPYNVLFPLTAIAGIYLAWGPARSIRERWIGAFIAGSGFALHSLFWRGWLIPYLVFFLILLAGLAVPRSRRAPDLSTRLYTALLIPVAIIPFAVLGLVWGPLGIRQEFSAAAEFMREFLKPDFKPWPDIFITVGELGPLEPKRLAALLGGFVWVAAILIGLLLSLIRRIRRGGSACSDVIPHVVLLGVNCVGLAVSVKIQRFAILAAAPLAASVPLAWTEWREQTLTLLPRVFSPLAMEPIRRSFRVLWAGATVAAVMLLSVFAHAEIVHFYPLYNTTWDRMMTKVREVTPENAILTSWWSPGHFLTSMGKRRVTFDGSSQNEPQAYWVANLFIANSERDALGILRMLDTSGDEAVNDLTSRGFSLSDAVDLIKTLIPLSRGEARAKLLRRFSETEADHLLDLTHGRNSPPPAYLFTYNHMIEQALALEFIGRWNFKKAEAFSSYVRQRPQDVDRRLLSRATRQNTKLLWDMSEQPTFYDSEGYQSDREGDFVAFTNGVRINLSTHEAEIRGNSKVNGRPFSVFWVNDKNDFIETPAANPTLQISVLLIEDPPAAAGGKPVYRSVIMGRRLAGSIAMRLYYLNGKGLRLIRPVANEDSAATRTRLALFEVDWKEFDRLLDDRRSNPTAS